ncbi:putative reverse transcriptase domain-containing protein [Tanacetum coccineum]
MQEVRRTWYAALGDILCIFGALSGSLRKNTEKRGNGGKPCRDCNVRDDHKRSRTGKAFASTTNFVRREYTGVAPKIVNPVNARNPTTTRGTYFECGCTDNCKAACPRLNRAPRQGGNRQNQAMDIEGGQGHGNNGNQARGGAFMIGAEEARHVPNIVTGTFTLNNKYVITLFDSGADYSFVSTTFIPLLGIEPISLEIEGHTFDIGLIPFGHGSFDAIMGLDWLSRHKAEIVCHEKVVRIPLPNGKLLRALGENPEEKMRHLMNAKTEE